MSTHWEEALETQATLWRQIHGPFWEEGKMLWLRNRQDAYGREAMLPSAHAFHMAGEIVDEAEPIFVASDMLALTRTAMETFDPREKVAPEDFFLRSGLALLEEQFKATDVDGYDVGWRCATWRYVELPPEAHPEGQLTPSLEIILWTDLNDTDGWDAQRVTMTN